MPYNKGGNWRGMPPETWRKVRAQHAVWQIDEPGLLISETFKRLFEFALLHPDAAMAHAQEQAAIETQLTGKEADLDAVRE